MSNQLLSNMLQSIPKEELLKALVDIGIIAKDDKIIEEPKEEAKQVKKRGRKSKAEKKAEMLAKPEMLKRAMKILERQRDNNIKKALRKQSLNIK